jgi:signal transduction histidine kinase
VIHADALVDRLHAGVVAVDRDLMVAAWNVFMTTHTGKPARDVVGTDLRLACPDAPAEWLAWKVRTVFELGTQAFSSWRQRPYVIRMPHNRPLTGGIDCMRQDLTFLPVFDRSGAVAQVCIVITDATDVAMAELAVARSHAATVREHAAREQLEAQLRLAHTAAMGQLAAGVAHELNTPMQFIGDSVQFALDSATELIGFAAKLPDDGSAQDVTILVDDLPIALRRAIDGVERVSRIVRSLRVFAQPQNGGSAVVDVNAAIENTLVLAASEYRSVADVALDLTPVRQVACLADEINVVLLNLIVNAARAITDAFALTGTRGVLGVRSRQLAGSVEIAISDTGAGIPADAVERVFDLAAAAAPAGKPTGLGLAMARAVVEKHGGRLWFETGDAGTTFYLDLPTSFASAAAPA